MIPYILGAAAVLGCIAAPLVVAILGTLRRPVSPVGDDVVTIFCRHCDGEWIYHCTCEGSCGRRNCDWEFERELAELLDEGDHQ